MDAGPLLLIAVLGVMFLVLRAWNDHAFRSRRMLTARTRRTILVHRVGLPSIRGVLVEEADDGIVLRRAVLLAEPARRGDPTPDPVPLAGEVCIRWDVVDCVQDERLGDVDRAPTKPPRASADSWTSATPPHARAWDAAPPDHRPLREVQ